MNEQHKTAKQLQEDFAYIINGEKGIGVETGQNKMTFLYHHGGTVSQYYNNKRIEATMPKDKKYLELKAKYYGDITKMSLFYPTTFKKDLDNNEKL